MTPETYAAIRAQALPRIAGRKATMKVSTSTRTYTIRASVEDLTDLLTRVHQAGVSCDYNLTGWTASDDETGHIVRVASKLEIVPDTDLDEAKLILMLPS